MKMTIRTKIIILILALIIVPLSTLGTASYIKSKDVLQNQFKKSIEELNNNIGGSIEDYFNGYKDGLEMISKNVDLEQIINHPEYEPFLMELFKDYMESYSGVTYIYLGTKDGNFRIYPNEDMGSDYDPTSRPWYKKAVEKQSVIFTDVYEDSITGQLLISCAAPVYENGDKNKLVGVVAIDLLLDEISEKVSSIKIGQKGYPYILDSNGTIIGHKDSEKIGQKTSVSEVLKGITNNNDSGFAKYEYKDSNGKIFEKISVYEKMPDMGWYVVSTMYMDEIKNVTKVILVNAALIGLVVLIIASIIGIIFANKLTNPIKAIVSDINKVKDGDFTVKLNIKSNDEIGVLSDNFNVMVENVKKLLLDAKKVSEEVANSATNLAATSEETSASAEEVARTVEEIARGASEQAEDAENGAKLASNLDDKFNKLANNTDTMFKNANEVMEINTLGVNVVEELKEKTDLNNESINKIESAVKQLSEKSSYIEDILDTIRAIAEQTNLLALNASIEAARAGEAGKGFAVVAEEIRKLAEGSSSATNEIKEIVDAIQEESKNTVQIMNEVRTVSIEQTKSVRDVNDAFVKISKSIDTITNEIDDVNKFVNDIIKDKDLIVESIENISAVSEETAAASEEVTASVQQQAMAIEEVAKSAEVLNELSLKLNEQIDKFKI
ncbi:methyl-accepting chemotaxis protein [Tepidibacter formicigenes]|jgi:methyl-accepting chemotaxis protein|uniref:Methyl-accepting chemotaxis sensory transducer with Cache sensor n=1 Tax=Tepidibacter formicigenes DSM 15518 TaxID=1123349 RepID=A0A1M6S4Y6_9FIRM|nr:methyl-accepting chemotaxis protein [Tepidibacter formicigenes]SHK39740.1 methyl-accepting chemotaxis sensory transducer with Cache sensor [Tepidibacter formicigenes DSM 15518]